MYFIHRRRVPEAALLEWHKICIERPLLEVQIGELKEWLKINAGDEWDYKTLVDHTDFHRVGLTFYVKNAKVAMLFKLTFC
jgi:hypothetical protein